MPTVTNNTSTAQVSVTFPTSQKVDVAVLATSPCRVNVLVRGAFSVIFPGQSKTFTERAGETMTVVLADGDAVESTPAAQS